MRNIRREVYVHLLVIVTYLLHHRSGKGYVRTRVWIHAARSDVHECIRSAHIALTVEVAWIGQWRTGMTDPCEVVDHVRGLAVVHHVTL